VDELTGVRPNRLERFGTPERFGDGARSARARMARVNLTLSANREFDQIAGSDLGRRSALATARAARGPGWASHKIAAGDFGRCREAATIRSEAEDERLSREQSRPLRHPESISPSGEKHDRSPRFVDRVFRCFE
jgi:hypothetical protein